MRLVASASACRLPQMTDRCIHARPSTRARARGENALLGVEVEPSPDNEGPRPRGRQRVATRHRPDLVALHMFSFRGPDRLGRDSRTEEYRYEPFACSVPMVVSQTRRSDQTTVNGSCMHQSRPVGVAGSCCSRQSCILRLPRHSSGSGLLLPQRPI